MNSIQQDGRDLLSGKVTFRLAQSDEDSNPGHVLESALLTTRAQVKEINDGLKSIGLAAQKLGGIISAPW